ncbi:MAG: hypothetical protein IT292_07585 [Deltaproteobacteria bacterium]|nr:hypothetical protein [Deltaproteobacteria bacterium]
MRSGSILVGPGEMVYKGQKIAEMGYSGRSSSNHLRFEVLGSGYNDTLDPWAGQCGAHKTQSLWDTGIQEAVDIISRSGENISESITCNEQICTLAD